jgi:signal transduction histidine kinase
VEAAQTGEIMTRPGIPFPWASSLLAFLIMAWQVVLDHPLWIEPYQLPEPLFSSESLLIASGLWILFLLWELQRFLKGWSGYLTKLKHRDEQITELFDSKRQLGTRARTYSDHADKLKLFISDKLLEYIEYDEKFLHFKNIASEVRHNGVISYDKAQTALKKAAALCADRLEDRDQGQQFEEAADSLLYLWDLLDIATTDNISLHVANRIYDSEEYYFQSTLNSADPSTLPYVPTFSLYQSLRKALLPITEHPEQLRHNIELFLPYEYCDERVQLLVESDSDMLGNINHMVLLLENLLNNALYYSAQKAGKNRANRITILLSHQKQQALIEIYNRGPYIKEEDRKHIFQLGYSSRRIRDHHGKGLGLYFVNEICKGFEGMVDFENIENQPNALSMRVELSNGEVENHFISVLENNGKAQCLIAQSDEAPANSLQWSFKNPLKSIEISAQADTDPQLINKLTGVENTCYYDKRNPLLPRWKLDISNRKKSAKVTFKPIDVRGVRFRVELPTALSRLEMQDGETEEI